MLLARFAAGEDWAPLGIPIRGPVARQIGEQLGEVQRWAAEWAAAAAGGPLRVEYKQVGGRHFGANSIPARAWLDSYDDAWALLGVRPDVRRLAGLIEAARGTRLVPWLTGHPMRALRLADDWDRLLATVSWIEQRQAPGMYLRQVDAPGVDTKFIERHKGVLTELLDAQLDPSRVVAGAADFAGRYGFLRRPGYVRFRVTGGYRGILRTVGPGGRVHRGALGCQPGLRDRERDHLPRVPGPGRGNGDLRRRVRRPGPGAAGLAGRARRGVLGRYRHARLRDPEPVAPLSAARPVHAHGPGYPAGPPGPLDNRAVPGHRVPWTASTRPSQLSTPTSSRIPTVCRSGWNRNGSASPRRRRQSPTVDQWHCDTTWNHFSVAMTLRLDHAQTEALRRKAAAEHRSMQQVALAAIDAYVQQPTPQRRRAVPVAELLEMFADLPPVDAQRFRADVDRHADSATYFDGYGRARRQGNA